MTKICVSCKTTKGTSEFHKRSAAKDGLQNICKECNNTQRKEYYKTANGREKSILTGKRNRQALAQKVLDYINSHPCVDCGERDPVVLEFDHRGDKSDNISQMIRNGNSWEKIEREIAKCDVRCANCHRRKTAKDFNWFKLTR